MSSSDFAAFKASDPARATFRALGALAILEQATSWSHLQAMVVKYNDPDIGRIVEAARRYDEVCSSGEKVLLHAVLYVTDFAWLADELDDGRSWRRMSNASGEYREAVAACIGANV